MGIGESDQICSLSQLESMHTGDLVQGQIEYGYWTTEKPVNPVENSTTIEFNVEGNGNEMNELSSCYLKVDAKITKADGSALDGGMHVAPINNLVHSLWNQVDVLLNDQLVSSRETQHALRSYIETVMNYEEEALTTRQTASLFYKDTAGQMDIADPAGANKGLEARSNYSKESGVIELIDRLHIDFFLQDKPLVNGVRMRIKLYKNKDTFLLMSSAAQPAFKLQIMDVTLHMRKIRLVDEVYKNIVSQDVVYPITRVETKDYLSPQGVKSFYLTNVSNGILPKRIILALVLNDAYNGSYTLNPYNFQHFGLSKLELNVNGIVYGGKPLEFDFAANKYLAGYWSLVTAMGKLSSHHGCTISREEYKSGYCLFAFDLTPTLCGSDQYIDPHQPGDTNISLTFKDNLSHAINAFVYMEHDSKIIITKTKQVIPAFAI